MNVVFQTLGLLVAGVVLSFLLRNTFDPLRRQPLAGVGVVIALVAVVGFFVHAYETGDTLSNSTSTTLPVSATEAQQAQQVADTTANNEFLTWARNTMVTDTNVHRHTEITYYIKPPAVMQEPELYQWSTYRLLPARVTGRLAEAQWILFYGVTPALPAYQGRQFDRLAEFSPGYVLAMRTDGS